MRVKHILKISAVISICAICSALSLCVCAENGDPDEQGETYTDDIVYTDETQQNPPETPAAPETPDEEYIPENTSVEVIPEVNDNETEYIPEENNTVYVPPESNGYEYFDEYHAGAEDYYYNDYYNDYYYDDYGNYSEETSYTDETASEQESELMEQGSVDTNELTSKDWENIQNSLNSKSEPGEATPENSQAFFANIDNNNEQSGEFGTLKDKSDSSDTNDTWIYLIVGIPLILAGAGIIAAVVIINVKANKKLKADQTISEHTADPLSKSIRDISEIKPTAKPKRPIFGPKHAAGGRHRASGNALPRDLVDTLDEPLALENVDILK